MTLTTKVGGTVTAAALALALTSCASDAPTETSTKEASVQSVAPAAATPSTSAAPDAEKAVVSPPKIGAADRSSLGEATIESAWKFATDFTIENTWDPGLLAKSRSEVTDADLLRVAPLMTKAALKDWRKQVRTRDENSAQGLMFYGIRDADTQPVTPGTVTDLTIFGDVSSEEDGRIEVALQHSASVHYVDKGEVTSWDPSLKTTYWLTKDGSSWKIDGWTIEENKTEGTTK